MHYINSHVFPSSECSVYTKEGNLKPNKDLLDKLKHKEEACRGWKQAAWEEYKEIVWRRTGQLVRPISVSFCSLYRTKLHLSLYYIIIYQKGRNKHLLAGFFSTFTITSGGFFQFALEKRPFWSEHKKSQQLLLFLTQNLRTEVALLMGK